MPNPKITPQNTDKTHAIIRLGAQGIMIIIIPIRNVYIGSCIHLDFKVVVFPETDKYVHNLNIPHLFLSLEEYHDLFSDLRYVM